jgi:ribosome-binding protein aMBF1 (putative translation factor)
MPKSTALAVKTFSFDTCRLILVLKSVIITGVAVKRGVMIDVIGEVVKYHRKKSGLSQLELANMAELGKTVIFDIEHGKESVKLSTIKRVFKVLNLKLKLEGPFVEEFLEKFEK